MFDYVLHGKHIAIKLLCKRKDKKGYLKIFDNIKINYLDGEFSKVFAYPYLYFPLNIGFSLDKKAASDTLHILSDSLAAEQSIYIPSEYKLDARKRRRMAPIVAAVAAATVADTSHEVYDNDCPETANQYRLWKGF